MRTGRAFSPAGISSFFTINDRDENGAPIADPRYVGACGGGFVITRGVTTEVKVARSRKPAVEVSINGKPSSDAITTQTVVRKVLGYVDERFNIRVDHKVAVPIGAGYGTSAAGALSTALVLAYLFDLELSVNQIGMIAHAAEIESKTGLGTVPPLMIGGCVLSVKPGGPGIAVIDRIPFRQDVAIVSVYINPIYTRSILSKVEYRDKVNRLGGQTLDKIQKRPTLEEFCRRSLRFAKQLGFMTTQLRKVASSLQKAGAIGVAQNMVGEAAHAAFAEEDADKVVKRLRRLHPSFLVFASRIDYTGPRILR